MISVCVATYNGERFIREQIDSILRQLSSDDEIIVSDDGSTDDTISIINSIDDKRIRIIEGPRKHSPTQNFECAMKEAKGDYIFLADQDDVWLPGKLDMMVAFMEQGRYDVVECNCALVDSELNVIKESYYSYEFPQKKSVFGNFVKNSWLGCCMAFKREALEAALPIPEKASAHDLWLCLYMQMHFKCGYMPDVLHLYRRHSNTVSFAGGKSTNSLWFKISTRAYLAWHLLLRSVLL